jgi:hypothetical protein
MFDKDTDKDVEIETEDFDVSGEDEAPEPRTLITAVSGATPIDMARIGLDEVAYIRRAVVNDVPMWTIHSAACEPLGAAHSFDKAWAAVRQNDLEPSRVQ